MENGVEETKTADGGTSVSHFNFVHNVVQVFNPHHDDEANLSEVQEAEAEEHRNPPGITTTKTADGAVSQFKLVDNVVQIFHDDNDNDDDVFEEAINENIPPHQIQTIAEANGTLAHIEKFEEALDSDLPTSGDHNPFEPVSSDVLLPEEELQNDLVSNGDAHGDANDTCGAMDVELVNDDHNSKQLQLDDSPDVVLSNGEEDNPVSASVANGETKTLPDTELECNGEEDDNQASASVANGGETKPLADTQLESNGEEGNAVVYGESANGSLNKSELEEPETKAEFSDFNSFVSGEIASSEQNKFDEQTPSEDDQCLSSNVDASVHGIVENRKTENGVSEKLDLYEKPVVFGNVSDVDKVSCVETAPTEGNESVRVALSEGKDFGEKVISPEDGQNCEMRDAAPSMATSPKEDISGMPEAKQNHTDTVIEERANTNAAELEEKGSHHVQAQHNSEIIQEAQKSETRVTPDESRKQDFTSVEEPHDSSSAGEPENQSAVEPVPAPPRRPAGLGAAAPLFEPASRALQQPRVNGAGPQRQAQLVEDPMIGEAEEHDETREKLQMIRVKFLRLAHRLGQTPHNVVVAQVLYRLGLAEQLRGRNAGRVGAFSFDRASAIAEQLESAGQEPLDFSCTIMVLGKTGVGKSATINSIFDEMKFSTDAFQVGTKKVQDVVGTVQGIKVRVIDTPGLLPCWSDQRQNEKILHSVKQFIKKTPPDIVLYLDRLDMQSRDFGDLPLLRTITEIFGPSIWFNAIVVLTHAASAPPDGPNGIPSSYEMFVTQRSHVVQQAIRQAAGDMRLMNPVSLVENHSACRTNRAGQRVLPNGQVWKPHLLLLSFASKILAEANTLLKLQDNPPGKPFATRPRAPPLPYLLSTLLQSRPQLKLPEEQFGDEDDLDDLDGSSDSEDDSEYDELPPFKPLTKAQLAKLSKAQKKAYFEELAYREKLFMKRQLKEEKKRRKLLKKMGDSAKETPNDYNENTEEESGGGASVPVAMPDFSLPASFDSDNPSHRYRFLDTSNPWLVRPVLETHGWDHDVGYEGVNVERLFVVKDKIPVSFSGQATKDKKESNLQMELASSIKHNEGKATTAGFEMQAIGKDMSYTLRSETRFSNFRHNKTAAGLSVTLLGDALTAGMKVEDRLIVNNMFRMVLTGGAMTARGDVAYGGSLEATLRDKDYPLGRMLSTLGLSIMDWHGELAIGCNLQSQIPIGRSSNVIGRANLNNKGSGQISIRVNSTEQLQIVLVALLPLFRKGLALYQQKMHGE